MTRFQPMPVSVPLFDRACCFLRPFFGTFCLLVGIASLPELRAEHALLTPDELSRTDLEEAWQRQLSTPAGAQSIVDHKIHVHGDGVKQYVEVVGKTGATDPTKAAAPKATKGTDQSQKDSGSGGKGVIYARYLLEVVDDPATAGNDATGVSTTGLMSSDQRRIGGLGRAAFGRGEFASSGLLDRAEAERLARNDIRRLKLRGIEAEIQSTEVPRVRLYTLFNDGTIESRDAETGELVWLHRVGSPVRGYGGLSVGDQFITILNGGEIVRLDIANGQELGTDQMRYVPLRGVKQCGEFAVVPSIGDRIVAYPLVNLRRDIFEEIVSGAALSMPTRAIGSEKLCWGSEGGFVYVIEMAGEPNIQFRLNTDGIVVGAPAAAPGQRFFFGSESGQIYGLRATRSGQVLWSRPTGDPIYDSPYFFDEKVLFRSTYGNLTCVDASTGLSVWDRSIGGIAEVIGVLDGRVFARTMSGSMVVLDLGTGKIAVRLNSMSPRVLQTNVQTDRIYLVNNSGTLQCLRPVGKEMPTISTTTEKQAGAEQLAADEKQKAKQKPKNDGGADPFAPAMADPFGAGGGADPFGAGGGADPFAPAAGGAADPFAPAGGGDDPFGANPF
ncbi:outer membrane protein assembly factor BamB family protein [Neorhodopirellula pilleata]|uniref:Outer membrane biogenesis protein BamB n=1 Tax=Neorhodopirellula pilleata TaxID=2714738 RepID=A0A5C6AWD3_9BACT|nr:PQQ-binding-like beta-propeller repeat protein [Neorhodopirellula pilleata]TWU03771.1 outer membrane biogenesis protein BamB [Neorhodopirellula pilleata]